MEYEETSDVSTGGVEEQSIDLFEDQNAIAADNERANAIGGAAIQQPPQEGGITTAQAVEDAAKQSAQLPEQPPETPPDGLNAPAFTQQDFYPNDPDPAQYRYETGLEVVARQGRMPMGAISKAAAHLHNKQARLDQQVADFDLYSKIGKTADPYMRNFVRIAKSQNDNFVKGIADAYYKGNERKAIRAIATDPVLRARWRSVNQDMEALGQHGQYAFNKATQYIQDGAEGFGTSAEGRELALDIVYGMGSVGTDAEGGDIQKMLNTMQRFEHVLGRDRYFNQWVLPQLKKDQMFVNTLDADTGLPFKLTSAKGRVIMTETQKRNYDSLKKVMAESMVADGISTLDEATKYLDGRLPGAVVSKSSVSTDPARSSSGANTSVEIGGVDKVASSSLFREKDGTIVDVSSPEWESKMQAGVEPQQVYRATITEITGGKRVSPTSKTLNSQYGQVQMYPSGVEMTEDGTLWITGRNANYVESVTGTEGHGQGQSTNTTTQDGDTSSSTSAAAGSSTVRESRRRVPEYIAVKLSDNKEAFRTYFGKTESEVRAMFPSAGKNTPTSPTAGKYSIKGKEYTLDELKGMGYTEEQVSQYLNK